MLRACQKAFDVRYCNSMVPVAQLAERQIVALEVVGSSPIGHPRSLLIYDAPDADAVGVRGIIVLARFRRR